MGGPALRSSRMFIVETFYGDLTIAEAELRAACAHLEGIGESWAATTAYAELALVLCDQGRFEEAAASAERSRETSAEDDPIGEAGWRASLGRAHAHTGLVEKAEILAKEAVEIVLATEHLLERADAFRALADVLDVAGRSEEAVEAAGLALQGYRKKGLTEKAHPVKRLESMLRSQPNA